jgi:hypothetical protein
VAADVNYYAYLTGIVIQDAMAALSKSWTGFISLCENGV